MKWNEMKWNEMKWNEMKWNEMKWKGKERKGKERKGKERKGKKRKEKRSEADGSERKRRNAQRGNILPSFLHLMIHALSSHAHTSFHALLFVCGRADARCDVHGEFQQRFIRHPSRIRENIRPDYKICYLGPGLLQHQELLAELNPHCSFESPERYLVQGSRKGRNRGHVLHREHQPSPWCGRVGGSRNTK